MKRKREKFAIKPVEHFQNPPWNKYLSKFLVFSVNSLGYSLHWKARQSYEYVLFCVFVGGDLSWLSVVQSLVAVIMYTQTFIDVSWYWETLRWIASRHCIVVFFVWFVVTKHLSLFLSNTWNFECFPLAKFANCFLNLCLRTVLSQKFLLSKRCWCWLSNSSAGISVKLVLHNLHIQFLFNCSNLSFKTKVS